MNPLIWIRLLAYADRVVLDRQRADEVDVAERAGAGRSRIVGELRVALERALAVGAGRNARGTVIGSDRCADGFFIRARGGTYERTLQVSPSGMGVECSYSASEAGRDGVHQRRLQVSFPSQQLVPAVILESGVSIRCDTTSVLCGQLLQPLKSRPSPLKAKRRNSGTASPKRRRLDK